MKDLHKARSTHATGKESIKSGKRESKKNKKQPSLLQMKVDGKTREREMKLGARM